MNLVKVRVDFFTFKRSAKALKVKRILEVRAYLRNINQDDIIYTQFAVNGGENVECSSDVI